MHHIVVKTGGDAVLRGGLKAGVIEDTENERCWSVQDRMEMAPSTCVKNKAASFTK